MSETLTLTQGDKAPVYAALPVDPAGAYTILATPLVVLTDSTGTPVPGQSGTADGFDMGALASPRIWWDLDTAALAPGAYTVLFSVQARGADNEARVLHPSVEIAVAARLDLGANAYALVRTRLQKTEDELPADTLRGEFGSAARALLARYPTLGPYADLAGDDKYWFDEAVALFTAARLIGPLSTGGANRDLQTWKQPDGAEMRFTQPRGAAGDEGERDRWLRESAQALGRVAAVRAVVQARASSFCPFAVTGPSRKQAPAGALPTPLLFLRELLDGYQSFFRDTPWVWGAVTEVSAQPPAAGGFEL